MQFSLRQKTRLGALRVRGKVLMLQSLLWDDEVREADFAALDETSEGVAAGARRCRRRWSTTWRPTSRPEKFSDEYQDQLKKLIAAKLEQGDKLDTAATFGEEGEKADERRGAST